MNHETIVRTQQLKRKQRIKSRLKKVVMILACVVVFCTTYALILPAITTPTETYCGLEEHFHTVECYEQVSREDPLLVCSPQTLGLHVHEPGCWDQDHHLICGQADYVAHTHDERCYDAQGAQICVLEERTTHIHTDECYRLVPAVTGQPVAEEQTAHTHDDSCYTVGQGELICTETETEAHSHHNDCYVPGEALLCTETATEHSHTETCYEQILQCTVEETLGHSHGETCYAVAKELSCGLEETEQTATSENEGVTDDAFVSPGSLELICGEIQAQTHVHGDTCFQEAQQALTCTLEESTVHTHSELCYGIWELRCQVEEHTHDTACYSNPEAHLETPKDWERTFAEVELRDLWQQDVLEIAKTQLGYKESDENYIVTETGVRKGYTRYGQWYGDPYGDWCAMFVSFCMHYGGVEGIPIHSGCTPWIRELKEMNLYRERGSYRPEAGDIIFFDWEGDGLSDHVGLVSEFVDATENGPAKVVTIEGNSSNKVQYVTYSPDDIRIAGYGQLSRNRLVHSYCGLDEHTHDEACYDEAGALLCALEEHTHDENCNSYKVVYYDNRMRTFAYIEGVENLPQDLTLKVTLIDPETDPQTYDSMSVALGEEMASHAQFVGDSAFYSIQLFSQEQPYELPEGASVRVEMTFHQPIFSEEQLENSNGVHTYLITPDPEATETETEPEIEPETEPTVATELETEPETETETTAETESESETESTAEAEGEEEKPPTKRQPTAVSDSEETSEPTEETEPAEEIEDPEEIIPVYQAQPAKEEQILEIDSGVTGVNFRMGEIGTVALAVTRQTVTGNFWKRIHSTSEVISGGTYMIVSVEGNFALVGNSTTNYQAVTLETVKGNEDYYIITDSSDNNLYWTFTASGSGYRVQNQGSSRYLNIGNDTIISTSSSNLVYLQYQSAEHVWHLGYKRFSSSSSLSSRLQTSNTGKFSRSSSSANESSMLLFMLVEETLDIPEDFVGGDSNVTTNPDGTVTMPEYDAVIAPSGSKTGETSLSGMVGNTATTVGGQYFSDPATSDIEREFKADSFADHELNNGKVLTDKSVIYMDDDYGAFDHYDPNTFGVTLSTLGQQYKLAHQEQVPTPVDVVFIIDASGSMGKDDVDDGSYSQRLIATIAATNTSIKQIMDQHKANRVGVVVYSGGAWELMPLDRYTADNDQYLQAKSTTIRHPNNNTNYTVLLATGSASLKNEAGESFANVGSDSTQGFGTYTQAGIGLGRDLFEAIDDEDTTWTGTVGEGNNQQVVSVQRQPVIILVSDGEPTYSTNNYMDPMNGPHYGNGDGDGANNAKGIHGYYTALTANYVKRMVSIKYQKQALFYTIGMFIYEEGDPNRPSDYASKTDDNYKIAVLNPETLFVENLQGQTNGKNIATTTDMYRQMMLSQYTGRTVTVAEDWKEEQLGIPHIYEPVLQGNPYADDYSYADDSYFGKITESELAQIFSGFIESSIEVSPYGFVLYEGSDMDMIDNIGEGMEVKGDPILRYNGVNYTHTSTTTVGNEKLYVYSYVHSDPYIPGHRVDLSRIDVKVIQNEDGTQTVEMYVPDSTLPIYTPELTALQDYYEMLPVRLIYQVGLTAESEERVLALQETGGELTFYTNKWQNPADAAVSSLIPSPNNTFYHDVADDGLTPQYHEHHDPKVENTTGTAENSVDCTMYHDPAIDDKTYVIHTLGNNGKLVFSAETTEIPVEKVWENVVADIMNPVTFELYRVTETITEEGILSITGVFVAEKTLDINNDWKEVFTATVPNDGSYYVIVETDVTGYQAFYGGSIVTFAVGNTPLTGVKVDFAQLETTPVRITNVPEKELIQTGGIGTTPYTLGGCILIAAACIALMYTTQRKGRKGGKAHS